MLTLGSDSHAVIDLLEEARRVELGERLASQERGHFTAVELATAATAAGHASLGWAEAGELAAGALADFVTVALDTPRTAGATQATALESVIFAATAADVASLVVGGAGGRDRRPPRARARRARSAVGGHRGRAALAASQATAASTAMAASTALCDWPRESRSLPAGVGWRQARADARGRVACLNAGRVGLAGG